MSVNRLSKNCLVLWLSLITSQLANAQLDIVATQAGEYQGSRSEYAAGVSVFKGIPYAAPPIRDLRWKAPIAPIPFAGVHVADKFGPACWQSTNPDNIVYARGILERSEDCLFLNVFSGAQQADEALPVMVWFHGGGNTAGHAAAKIFDGSNLAARKAVIVTANYRLGALGFLSHPSLTAESAEVSSGNYGILDQIQALRWVQNNIARFGGDPQRVTIFGQSAGGTDVCLIMSSPLAEGLIDGVIGQSPGCIKMQTTLDQGSNSGHATGLRFASALGVNGTGTQALKQLREIAPADLLTTGIGTAPVIDGWVVPAAPYDLLSTGAQNRIPVMVGGLAHENHGLQSSSPEISEDELTSYLQRIFGRDATEVAALYAEMEIGTPLDARKQISTDNGFLLSSRMWGRLVRERGNDAFVYFFTREPPVFRLYVPEDPDLYGDGGQRHLGAYHSGELAYVFDNMDLVGVGWDAEDRALAKTMADYWVSFARNGNPNADGLPFWPSYDAERDIVQVLDTVVRPSSHPRKEELDMLEFLFLRRE